MDSHTGAFPLLNQPYGPDLDWVKKTLFVILCFIINPSVAFAASSPPLQLMLVFLSPSILFINTFMFIHPSIGLSIHVAFCPTCLLSQLELLQVFIFWKGLLQIIKWMLELELDYLSWLHKSSNSSRLCHCVPCGGGDGGCLNIWV